MSVCQECDVPAKVRATRDLSNNIPLTVSEGHDALIPGVFVQQKQTKRVPAGENTVHTPLITGRAFLTSEGYYFNLKKNND